MRRFVAWAAALAIVFCVWTGSAAARRKSSSKKSAPASASKGSKKASTPKTTWRNRQTAPTPERYREIQQALSAKGYLSANQVNGRWSDESADAMKRFQADQK